MKKLKRIILIMIAVPADPKNPSDPKAGYMTQGSPSMTITIPDSHEQPGFAMQS